MTTRGRRVAHAMAAALLIAITQPAVAQLPASLTDAEFWRLYTTLSEPGGNFASENFVSNEVDFQQVIPTLQRTVTPGGVYLGVGPEQNFTYIANLQPAMAILFDIRPQNAMLHLMYKALFELSPTRAEFVARLFSRPLAGAPNTRATAEQLFIGALRTPSDAPAFAANLDSVFAVLVGRHHFELSEADRESIGRVYKTFYEIGPAINYSYRSSPNAPATGSPSFVSYAALMSAAAFDSVNMAFLASEQLYQRVRDLEGRNLVLPLIGDFGGPKAIRAVGDYLRERQAKVMAMYVSNVEQYLWNPGTASDNFYRSVATLPLDSTSTFIRSVPRPARDPNATVQSSYNVLIPDGRGGQLVRRATLTTFTVDSAGQQVRRTRIDTSATAPPPPPPPPPPPGPFADVLRLPVPGLVSGLAPMAATVAKYKANALSSYQAVIDMTKLTGWK